MLRERMRWRWRRQWWHKRCRSAAQNTVSLAFLFLYTAFPVDHLKSDQSIPFWWDIFKYLQQVFHFYDATEAHSHSWLGLGVSWPGHGATARATREGQGGGGERLNLIVTVEDMLSRVLLSPRGSREGNVASPLIRFSPCHVNWVLLCGVDLGSRRGLRRPVRLLLVPCRNHDLCEGKYT